MFKKILGSLFIISYSCFSLDAAWTIKNGKLVNADYVATLSDEEHYKLGMEALEQKDWKTAATNFQIVVTCFPKSLFAKDGNYYLGVALFHLQEFDFANDAFSHYISSLNHPQFFMQAIEYKYYIAESFRKGACRRFFNTKQLPKWASGKELALTIYDEVIAALPSHEFAVRSLYSKACLLLQMKQYRESIDALQLLVKRFPKHEFAPKSYLLITDIYQELGHVEFQNPDLLALAEINVRHFKARFPRDERVQDAEKAVLSIKEAYARGLYETGQFYERIEQKKASIIYYKNAISQFPETSIASLCEERLNCLMR